MTSAIGMIIEIGKGSTDHLSRDEVGFMKVVQGTEKERIGIVTKEA